MTEPSTAVLESPSSGSQAIGAVEHPTDPEAVVAAARRRQRRRHVRVAALGLGVFALGIGLWFLIGSRGRGLAVDEIEARELAALHSRTAALILFERKQPEVRNLGLPPGFSVSRCMGCGLTKTWINLAAGGRRDLYYSPSGRLIGQNTEALLRNGHFASGQVNYKTRSWSESNIPLRSAKTRRQIAKTLSPLNEANLPGSGRNEGWSFRLIGRQTIDGQLTLHLQETHAKPTQPTRAATTHPKPASKSRTANGTYFAVTPTRSQGRPTFDIWLNAQTYLPVREQIRGPSGRVQSTSTYKWLPRTETNLAALKLNVPPGFADELASTHSRTHRRHHPGPTLPEIRDRDVNHPPIHR